MDKKKSILNVSVSIGLKIITMVMVIVVKRLLIRSCGNEVNGLNALYISIVGFLSIAELGVGSAITFCMYKPIVDGDNPKVSALYGLFQKVYSVVGLVIFVVGLAITPFVHLLAADYTCLDVNLYVTFVLMLISVVISYFFGAKTSLINAYKNNYITAVISSGGLVLQYILQIVALLITNSFVWYLICRIITATVQWGVTELVTRKKYGNIISGGGKLDQETTYDLVKSIKAMFMHKVGTLLVNTVDNIIISTFVGVVILGKYSNYTTIMASMASILQMMFSALTTSVGHLYVEKHKTITMRYCEGFHMLSFLIGAVFYLGYYAIVDNLVALLFSADLIVEKKISLAITLNGFIQFMRLSVMMFRDATGTFYYDRWKPFVEGILNVILSIFFVKWIGVTGVIISTIITNLTICHIVEPYVLYRHAFEISPLKYYLKNYGLILLFFVMVKLFQYVMQDFENQWVELLVNGWISVGISLGVCLLLVLSSSKLRNGILRIIRSH